jgi:acetyl esterase/lipase
LYPDWFSKWALDYAEAHGAVIICPNYRLVPEVKAKDVIDDMKEFWAWFRADGAQKHLASIGRSDVSLDVDRLLLMGESAGAYLAIQSILSQMIRPRCIIAVYPMLDLASEYYNTAFEKPIFGSPNVPTEIVDKYLNDPEKKVITEDNPPSRAVFAMSMVQNGRVLEVMGNEPEILPIERLRTRNLPPRDEKEPILPPMFVFHGEQDSAVPVDGTKKFVQVLAEADPESKVHMALRPGDHGFDSTTSVDEDWMQEGLAFVTKAWL